MQIPKAVWAIALQCSQVYAADHSLAMRQTQPKEDPDVESFIRRVDTAVAVLNDYLYIVGGHVAAEIDGELQVRAINATLSIPLSDDWDPADVEINSFAPDAGPRPIWGHGFWANYDEEHLLLWGGSDVSEDDTGARERKLWRLLPDERGGGNWETDDVPSEIKRTTRGGYASCGGTGYAMGGRGNIRTDKSAFGENGVVVPGLITYDFDKKDWHNQSTTAVTEDGGWLRGEALCVEMPDRSPKLLLFGGTPSLDEGEAVDFVYVHYWDPDQKKWFQQETVGTRPPSRVDTCAVGVPGPNGTYEIFLYGGWGGTFSEGNVLDDVWILSIPAFRWFKESLDNAQGRYAHKCVRVGSQMLVVGGGARRDWWRSTDTLDRGFGILDLNSISWKSGFEANSREYQPPEAVRDWYEKHGYDKTIWENDEVEKAFGHNSDSGPSPSPTPSSGSGSGSGSSSSNTPAIVGGTVGGVVGLALIGLFVWYLMRRRRRRRQQHGQSNGAPPIAQHGYYEAVKPAEADGAPSTQFSLTPETGTPLRPHELDATGRRQPAELP